MRTIVINKIVGLSTNQEIDLFKLSVFLTGGIYVVYYFKNNEFIVRTAAAIEIAIAANKPYINIENYNNFTINKL